MNESKSVVAHQDRPQTIVYRSVSILALISLMIAAGYAAIATLVGIVCFLTSEPFLMPDWTLLFPVSAAVMALVAGVKIKRSEGTQSGARLAAWGLWLSILFGAG